MEAPDSYKPLVSTVSQQEDPRKEKGAAPQPKEEEKPVVLSFFNVLAALEDGRQIAELIPRSASSQNLARSARAKGRKFKEQPEAYEGLLELAPRPPGFGERNKLPPKPSEAELKSMVNTMCRFNFTPIPSVPRDRADPHYKEGGGLANLTTLQLTQTTYNKAIDVAMRVVQLPFEHFTAAEVREAYSLVDRAYKYQVTNGPLIGLYRRFFESAGKQKPRLPPEKDLEVMKAAIKELLPYDPNRLASMAGKSVRQCTWLMLNLNADSGYPFCKQKKDVVKEGYELAARFFDAAAENTMPQFIKEHPQCMLVQLKNKLDLYEYADTHKSIRAYYVYPFHLVILYSCLIQNISRAYLNFTDDAESFNAHGFSWMKGGAQRLYDWIQGRIAKGPGLYGIAYSDDQLWVAVCADGSVYIICPDYKRMDLHLANWWGRLAFEHWTEMMGARLDKTWTAILRLLCQQAFTSMMIIGYALVYVIENFLRSGVPGTPEFDQIASAGAFGIIKRIVGAPADAAALTERLGQALAMVTKLTGLEVKPGTDALHPFTPDQKSYPWTFLGKKLLRWEVSPGKAYYVPASDPVKALASMISPKKKLDGISQICAQMTRIRDIIACGAWTSPQLYFAAASWYKTMLTLHNKPKDPLEVDQEQPWAFRGPVTLPQWPTTEFPSVAQCANLYLPVGHEYVESAVATPGMPAPASSLSLEAALEKLYGGDSWADQDPYETRHDADKGIIPTQHQPKIEVAQQGRVLPLSQAKKDAYNKKLREARAALLTLKRGGSYAPKPAGPRKGKMAGFSKFVNAVREDVHFLDKEQLEPEQSEYEPDYDRDYPDITDDDLDAMQEQLEVEIYRDRKAEDSAW